MQFALGSHTLLLRHLPLSLLPFFSFNIMGVVLHRAGSNLLRRGAMGWDGLSAAPIFTDEYLLT